jgi:hypothetical protein
MNISLETRQAYLEVDYIIELLSDYEKNKIPKKLRDFFKREKYAHYEKNINIKDIIENKALKKETLALVAFLNIKYICEDENEKQRLRKIYAKNEIEYQERLREKYNSNNLFKNKNNFSEMIQDKISTEAAMVGYKEKNFIQRLFDKIKNLFRKN